MADMKISVSTENTFGIGQQFGHSTESWRALIRQAWLCGLLNREMKRGVGARMVNGVIFNVYAITKEGIEFLANPQEILLPAIATTAKEAGLNTKSISQQHSRRYMYYCARFFLCFFFRRCIYA